MNKSMLYTAAFILVSLTGPVLAVDIMNSSALASFPNPPADHVISYGEDRLQFAELRLPPGQGPFPVMLLIHGGCWLAEYDIAHIRKLAAAFTAEGIATWTIEYRRVGDNGGGWPGTFDDVAAATDHLVSMAGKFELDLDRFITAGHSAGGHLAIWLANRPSQWPAKLKPGAVLALAGWRQIYRAEGLLVDSGLYRYIRHPQYTGFFLFLTGSLINWPTLITLFMFPILLVVYRRLAAEEEAEALGVFGLEYENYRCRTGMFLPRFALGTDGFLR